VGMNGYEFKAGKIGMGNCGINVNQYFWQYRKLITFLSVHVCLFKHKISILILWFKLFSIISYKSHDMITGANIEYK
jgi:hypothetical protein